MSEIFIKTKIGIFLIFEIHFQIFEIHFQIFEIHFQISEIHFQIFEIHFQCMHEAVTYIIVAIYSTVQY